MKKMLCSLCKSDLIVNGQARLETLGEHICCPDEDPYMKNRYVCSNDSCTSHLHKICWNEDGEQYGRSVLLSARAYWDNPNFIFIDNNPAPFNSIWREIYMDNERDGDTYYVLPWVTGKFGFRIEAKKWRRFDEGVLVDFGTNFEIQTRRGKLGGKPHYGINGWHMFWFSMGQYFNERKWNKKFELKHNGFDDGEWWRTWSYNVKYMIEKYWYKSNPIYKK